MNEDKNNDMKIEDTTKYGEFVTSYFSWIPLEKQKEITKRMEKMTGKNKKL